MDAIDAAIKLVSIEWDSREARLAYEALQDEVMVELLEKVIANAQEMIAWATPKSLVK